MKNEAGDTNEVLEEAAEDTEEEGVNCQAQVQSPKVQSPKVKTKGTWADTIITWEQGCGVVLHVQGEVYQ